jgi:AAHS family 4-hydroxybenzoate transporter-like MFS transporter
VSQLFSMPWLPGTLMLWVTYFMGLVIYYVLLSWMPTLMQGMGYALAESAWLTSLFTFGGTAGILLAGWMMDRWEAHRVVACGFVLTMGLILLLGIEHNHIALFGGLIFLMGIAMNGAIGHANPGRHLLPYRVPRDGHRLDAGDRPLWRRGGNHDQRPASFHAVAGGQYFNDPQRARSGGRCGNRLQNAVQPLAGTRRRVVPLFSAILPPQLRGQHA